ncbi:hypothetical protein [Sphingomonas aurea]|nr:hypothetical protein [Sphingomonas sp. KR1UV-12]
MELRLIVAYGLIGVIVLAAAITTVVVSRKRAARRRRLRGIKDYPSAS